MVWFKVDDKLHGDRRARRAGVAAMGLWALAGAWASDQLTDGFVPEWVPASLGATAEMAARLVTAGLWIETTDAENDETGWQFTPWAPDQPLRADVLADREANNKRQQMKRIPGLVAAIKKRDGDRCRYCGIKGNHTDRRGPTGLTYDHVDPTGPSSVDNCVTSCRSCNSKKARRTPDQAGMTLLPEPRRGQPRRRQSAAQNPSRAEPRYVPGSELSTDQGSPGVTPGRVGLGSGAVPSAASDAQTSSPDHEEAPTTQRLTLAELADYRAPTTTPAPPPGRLTTGKSFADLVVVPGSAPLEAEGDVVTNDSGGETSR
ncbi:5-methylcytosine-specific restriction endonuclease McrA [Klenkia marina]|uniref:5-methylcytosine-specific restriction endonuclease McrA n=1 Tax=Klenkia marina TaxID=1960309 RepID=A0A1G4Y680_9ACTN|nr:HNH endonuclease signature motif containing protein [Klenkia marina]SCX48984.1 5-methylcytosine-specific restriction endonuclease McrA [Klenkia marina]